MNPTQQKRLIGVNPDMVRNQIKLFEAKLEMQQQKLRATVNHGKQTRTLTREVIEAVVGPLRWKTFASIVNAWHSTHQQVENADLEIVKVAIAELESQIFIHNEMLKELETPPSLIT